MQAPICLSRFSCSHPAICDSRSWPVVWPQAPTNHRWSAGWPHVCQHHWGRTGWPQASLPALWVVGKPSPPTSLSPSVGGLLIGVSPPGSPGGTPEVYQPSAAKSLQESFTVPAETMQRTQSPSHTQVLVGLSEMTNKVASGLPRATTVSKVPLTQPQTPKAPKHNRASCCLALWLLVISGHSKVRRL